MVRLVQNLPKPTDENVGILTQDVVATQLLHVDDTSLISPGDILLIEEFGNELNETVVVDSITGNTVILEEPIIIPHKKGTSLHIVEYNKYAIVRKDSTDTTLVSDYIDYANQYSSIIFQDDSDGSSYKKQYKLVLTNTSTNTSSEVILEPREVGYVSVSKLYRDFSISESTLPQSSLISAIHFGAEYIRDRAFRRFTAQATQKDTMFDIDFDTWTFADWNADGTIDADDFYVFEYNQQTNETVFVNHLISKVITRQGHEKIIFTKELPRQNFSLNFAIKTAQQPFEELKSVLERVNQLLAANYILQNTNNKNVRDGVLSWSAGGTSVNRDSGSVERVVEKNEEHVRNLIQKLLTKIHVQRTKLRTERSQFFMRASGQYNRRYSSMMRGR
jgi:hypothetical protein